MKNHLALALILALLASCSPAPAATPEMPPSSTVTVSPVPPTATFTPSPLPPTATRPPREGLIAFYMNQGNMGGIYVIKADGSGTPVLLSAHPFRDSKPAWSPDGAKVAFESIRDDVVKQKHLDIYVMNADGSHLARLTNTDGWYTEPAWSPDGKQLAMAALGEDSSNLDIYLLDLGSKEMTKVTDSPDTERMPSWSPDGSHLVYALNTGGSWNIFTVELETGDTAQLTQGTGDNFQPDWSPDGNKILFVSKRDGEAEIYIMDASGENQKRLTTAPGLDTDPEWSPEGNSFAYAHGDSKFGEIYISDLNGSSPELLFENKGQYAGFPAWSAPATISYEPVFGPPFCLRDTDGDLRPDVVTNTFSTQDTLPYIAFPYRNMKSGLATSVHWDYQNSDMDSLNMELAWKQDENGWYVAPAEGRPLSEIGPRKVTVKLFIGDELMQEIMCEVTEPHPHTASILYAQSDGVGQTCDSWKNACGLQNALTAAGAGDEIWVKAGIYKPAVDTRSPAIPFRLKTGVAIYGGFAGTEATRDQRNWETNITVLSGDLGGDDITDPNGIVTDTANIVGQNAYHVVLGSGVDNTAILDGFVITAGYASQKPPNVHGFGGGMFMQAGSPTLNNLVFSGNTAGKGAAYYGGGGMYISFASNPVLTHVTFVANSAGGSAGMFNDRGSNPVLNDVTFSGNKAIDASCMGNYAGSNPILNDIVFEDNSSSNKGCMVNENGHPTMNHVTFSNNSAKYGAGMYNYKSSPTLTDVVFSNNVAGHVGGAMENEDHSNPVLTNVLFSANSAYHQGGAMFNIVGSNPSLTNVAFINNRVTGDGGGGGMQNSNSSPTLTNVTFSGNQAVVGGGIDNWQSDLTLTNVTFSGNTAGKYGAAMYSQESAPTIVNTIIWGNTPGDSQMLNDRGLSDVTYSIIAGGHRGTGNLNVNPKLGTLADNGGFTLTYSLTPGSPAVDAGSPSNCPRMDQRDLPRPIDGDGNGSAVCDMGAFESQSVVQPQAATATATVPPNLPKSGNLALNQAVTTSSSEMARPARLAVDGSTSTDWGSGDFPPQWIEIDLGAPATVKEFRLLVTQFPNGTTLHRILARSPDGDFTEIHHFEGSTSTGKWLTFKPAQPLENIQFVRIETTKSPSWVGWVEIQVLGER